MSRLYRRIAEAAADGDRTLCDLLLRVVPPSERSALGTRLDSSTLFELNAMGLLVSSDS